MRAPTLIHCFEFSENFPISKKNLALFPCFTKWTIFDLFCCCCCLCLCLNLISMSYKMCVYIYWAIAFHIIILIQLMMMSWAWVSLEVGVKKINQIAQNNWHRNFSLRFFFIWFVSVKVFLIWIDSKLIVGDFFSSLFFSTVQFTVLIH